MKIKASVLFLAASALAAAGDESAVLFLHGVPSAAALAVDSQGGPFVSVDAPGGRIVRLLARDTSMQFTATGGAPCGMAFAANGDLYVADRQRKALLRISQWGSIDVAATGFSAPEGVAIGAGGEIYVADTGASEVWRVGPQGRASVLVAGLPGVRAIVAAIEGKDVFVSARGRQIWRFDEEGRNRMLLTTLQGAGEVAALALDDRGNLYAARDGGGAVSVLNPQGRLIRSYPISGPRVTGIAFGGLDLKTLFVTEAKAGAVYTMPALSRSQKLPWEPNQPVRIVDPPDGAILNRHDGQTTAQGLRVTVKGVSRLAGPVEVNGVAARVRDGKFEAPVLLRERENQVIVTADGERSFVTLLWDRDSYPRYRFSTDDNILFLKDIARHVATYHSIFDNEYMAFWREMHRKYGMKIDFNVYYETEGFNLSQMPDKFRDEWQRNADWIRLTFHARANDPDYYYIKASPEQIRADYRQVMHEIERFAGKQLFSPVDTLHWGFCPKATCEALRDEGVRVFVAPFSSMDGLPFCDMYVPLAQSLYANKHDYWKDTGTGITFVLHDLILNMVPMDEIVPELEKIAADPHRSEIIELIIHEEYFYPDYKNYEPDYRARCERALEWVTGRGYRPVFYEDGFLGAMAGK